MTASLNSSLKHKASSRIMLKKRLRINPARGKSRAGSADHAYDFRLRDAAGRLTTDPMVSALLSTAAFRRLKDIRFLGGIDYLLVPVPNGSEGYTRYTRHEHSQGVALLAMIYADELKLREPERRLVVAAALLHDIGHCALSHTLEPVFYSIFGVNHHTVTEEILRGDLDIGHDVANTLKSFGVDVDALISLISGKDNSYNEFFSGPINFDTIEGILRSWIYVQYERRFPAPDAVMRAALRRCTVKDREMVDQFWMYKDRVYNYLIRSPRGAVADYLCQEAFKVDVAGLRPTDFLTTERSLFLKAPALSNLIRSGIPWSHLEHIISQPIEFEVRRFYTDPAGDFFARQDAIRYRQTKEPRLIPGAIGWVSTATEELFNV